MKVQVAKKMPTWMERFLIEQEREGKGIEQQGSVQYGGRVQGGTDHTSNMHAAILLCT
jgi:hypothetical protein